MKKLIFSGLLTLITSASAHAAVTCELPGDIRANVTVSGLDSLSATLTVDGESVSAVSDCRVIRPFGRRAYARCPFQNGDTRYEVYPEIFADFKGTELKDLTRTQIIVWRGSNPHRIVSESCGN